MTRVLAICRQEERVTYRACEELMALDGDLEVIGQLARTKKKVSNFFCCLKGEKKVVCDDASGGRLFFICNVLK